MKTRTMTNIWASEQLSFHAKGVYELLHHYANPDSGECWPGIDTLSRKAGLSRPTILKAIRELETGQKIQVRRRKGFSSRYVLLSTTNQCHLPPPVKDVYPKERSSYEDYQEQKNDGKGNVPLSRQAFFQPAEKTSRAMQSLGLRVMETEDGEVFFCDVE